MYILYLYIHIYYIQTDNIMRLQYCAHVYYSIFPGGKFTLNSVPLFSYTILNSCLHRGLWHHHRPPSPLCMKAFYLPPFSSHGQIKQADTRSILGGYYYTHIIYVVYNIHENKRDKGATNQLNYMKFKTYQFFFPFIMCSTTYNIIYQMELNKYIIILKKKIIAGL